MDEKIKVIVQFFVSDLKLQKTVATNIKLLLEASIETLYMVSITTFFTVIIGLPLGILLVILNQGGLLENKLLYGIISYIVNVMRSIPFLILLVFLIGFTRLIVGTSIGTNAVIVPLVIAAIPFFGRLTETSLLEVDKGVIEAASAMGATPLQIIFNVMLPESFSQMVANITTTIINVIGYSAMAGVVGGGGLGQLAIRYGYQRNDTVITISTVVILVIIVQIVQTIGNKLATKCS